MEDEAISPFMTQSYDFGIGGSGHVAPPRLNIWRIPTAKAIKDAMRCQVCGNVGAPPNYQCENGHLVCKRHCEDETSGSIQQLQRDSRERVSSITSQHRPLSSSSSSSLRRSRIIQKCPVVLVDEETAETSICGSDVFEGALELYTHFYNASIMNCPATPNGCDEKFAPPDLKLHLNDCYFNKQIICPNTLCKFKVPATRVTEHLITVHKLPVFESKTVDVKVFQETEKHKKTLSSGEHCQWVGAIIKYGGQILQFVLREEENFIAVWLHQMKPQISDLESVGKDSSEQLQLEGVVPKIPIEKLQCKFVFKSETTLLQEYWVGSVSSCNKTSGSVINSGSYFKSYISNLKKRYMVEDKDSGLHVWNVQIVLEEIEEGLSLSLDDNNESQALIDDQEEEVGKCF